jgi:hypothetical protein
LPDVVGQRFTDILRQRQAVMPLSLAANEEFARTPIDIVNPDRNDFRCA